ncbi:MAG TPA: hypothetical protein VE093_19035 [Polyangiaceae bacterium]|jgi:hypothetical protein|nr:hypothetical protein [Polyangiaceae bacterium]
MVRPLIGSLLLVSTLALAGCTDGTGASIPEVTDVIDTYTEEEAFTGGSLVPELLGTFRADALHIGELTMLALKSDGTFHYGMVVACVAGQECAPAAEDGQYKLLHRASDRFIELYNVKDILRGRFQYELVGDTLRLRRTDTGGGEWRSMSRTDAPWCASASDCGLQNLKGAECAGAWECSKNECAFQCDDHADVPSCMFDGSEHEGWYVDDGSELLCNAKCAGASVRCGGPGATAGGYYAVQGEGCVGSLIMRGSCSP